MLQSRVFSTVKGGLVSNTIVLPSSFKVGHSCLPSGDAAMSWQNGLACVTRPTIYFVALSMTAVSSEKLEHT